MNMPYCIYGVSWDDTPDPGSSTYGYVLRVCFGGVFGRALRLSRLLIDKNEGSEFRVMFRGCGSGYDSPKSNFLALLELEHPKQIQTYAMSHISNINIVIMSYRYAQEIRNVFSLSILCCFHVPFTLKPLQ